MARLFIKSSRSSGMLDTGTNTATIRGKEFQLPLNLVLEVGDSVSVKGEQFTILPLLPVFFSEYAKRSAQIIQPWDIGAILQYTGIAPGSRVLESGSGSGALSAAILRAIGESGLLVTVEKDPSNITIARENASMSSAHGNWELVESPIEAYTTEKRFDVAILDVPEPWNVVAGISRNLVPGGRICCYSPTYNQMEKNVLSLKKAGFFLVDSMEILKRSQLVRENSTRPDNNMIGHTAFMTFAVKLSGSSARTDS